MKNKLDSWREESECQIQRKPQSFMRLHLPITRIRVSYIVIIKMSITCALHIIMCSSFEVEPTSILPGLRRGQRDERLDVVVRQSGENSSANQPTCDNVNKNNC